MGKKYNEPMRNNAQVYLQPNTNAPVQNSMVRQRVQMLNAGQIQPGAGDPQFAVRMNQALELERAREQQLQAQAQREREQFMASLPSGNTAPADPLSGPKPGTSVHRWLTDLSQNSPQGHLQAGINKINDQKLKERLMQIQNDPMPAEMGSPSLMGKVFELWMQALGHKRAL